MHVYISVFLSKNVNKQNYTFIRLSIEKIKIHPKLFGAI